MTTASEWTSFLERRDRAAGRKPKEVREHYPGLTIIEREDPAPLVDVWVLVSGDRRLVSVRHLSEIWERFRWSHEVRIVVT